MSYGFRAAVIGSALMGLAASNAPFQCASETDPNRHREEEPGEALYTLAEHFEARGNRKAQLDTLRFLVKRYPESRFAERARVELQEIEGGGNKP